MENTDPELDDLRAEARALVAAMTEEQAAEILSLFNR